jgi:RNA recognition motif-containing protein
LQDLSKLFKAHNPTQIRLHKDKVSGRSKGFAHVHFADDAALKK